MSIGPGHPHPIQFGLEAVLHLDQGVKNPLTELIERLTETFLLHPLQPVGVLDEIQTAPLAHAPLRAGTPSNIGSET